MTIHKSEFYLLDEILEDMLKDKDTLIQESEIRRGKELPTRREMDAVTSEYVRRMDEGDEDARRWWRRSTGFSFSTGRWRILWRTRSSIFTKTGGEGPGYINFCVIPGGRRWQARRRR